jgi:hypothetical protein
MSSVMSQANIGLMLADALYQILWENLFMIVQTAPQGEPHFVIRQIDHAHTAGSLAVHYGNQKFEAIIPRDIMEYVILHHDHGWEAVDAAPMMDPKTGLPYHLGQTPLSTLLTTNEGSPAYNEKHHPFAGLISSMHTRGFYNGGYGLREVTYRDIFPPETHAQFEALLNREEERQNRLKAQLRANEDTAHWADDAFIMANYKLLQFFDGLALYFHLTHPSQRGEAHFNVPLNHEQDTTITLKPASEGYYTMSPYPFAISEVEVTTEGRYVMPIPEGQSVNMAEYVYSQPVASQSYRLIPVEGEQTYVSIT